MPLINFKTDLTSLKYGLDKPGGGYSGLPYNQFPIENANTPPAIRRYYELNRTSLDFPIRGGSINLLQTGIISPLSSTIDRELIQKFLESSPKGKAFVDKQRGLQLTNPRTQVPNTISFPGLGQGNVVIPITQTYNPLNTLAQVQVQGTGAHFNYMGQFPQISETVRGTYEFIAGAPQNNTPTTNRLLILKSLKLNIQNNFNVLSNNIVGNNIDNTTLERLGISPISNQLFNYQGGPGSVYGIGNTRIFRVTNTEPFQDPITEQSYSAIALTYNQLANQKTYDIPTNVKVQDFRRQTNNDNPIIQISDYDTYNIASPYNGVGGLGIGNPGTAFSGSRFFITQETPGVDQLNKLNPYYYQAYGEGGVNPWQAGGRNTKDIIKFMFECMSNDEPNFAIAIPFRAFLDGSIDDSNQAQYNTFKYLGRGETFRTYQGFDRTISFSFKVFVQSRSEMQPLYTKINTLISQVYPDYNPSNGLMRSSVIRLTIGDYLYRMPGFIENVDVSVDNSSTPWEIVLLGNDVEYDVAQLPQYVAISITFKPIFDVLPSRITKSRQNVPLLANVPGNSFLNSIVDTTAKGITPANDSPQSSELDATVNPSQVIGATSQGNADMIPNQLRRQNRVTQGQKARQQRQAARRAASLGRGEGISEPTPVSIR